MITGPLRPMPWRLRVASSRELVRVVRFCSVGVSNTAITLLAFTLLVHAGCPGWIASGLAFAAGAVNGYHWNAGWTFADRHTGASPGGRVT